MKKEGTTVENDQSIVDRLAKQNVFDEDHNQILLESLWADQGAVLVFIRHFG